MANRVCVLRYDNEAGKGDHRHTADGREEDYRFGGMDALVEDFWRDVDAWMTHRSSGDGMTDEPTTVILSVASREETAARMRAALRGEPQGAHITFPTVELLWRVVTPKRLAILRAMAGGEAISIREVARRVGRDVKAVHGGHPRVGRCGDLGGHRARRAVRLRCCAGPSSPCRRREERRIGKCSR